MTRERARLYIAFCVYFVCVLIGVLLPTAVQNWNRINPKVLSLPLSQFTVIAAALLLIVGLALWFVMEGRLNLREKKLREACNDKH